MYYLKQIENYYNNNINTSVFHNLNQCNNYLKNNVQDFKIFNFNIPRLNKNFSELCVLIQSFIYNFDILILTETWLNYDIGCDIPNNEKFVKSFAHFVKMRLFVKWYSST